MKNLLPVIAALLALMACVPQGIARETARLELHSGSGVHVIRVEIAADDASRSRGLQHRTHLDPDQGMLFDFHHEQQVSFWMKDTPLSLDMLFFDATGKLLLTVSDTIPYSLDPVRPGPRVRYVLEMLAGSAERLNMRPGDRMKLKAE